MCIVATENGLCVKHVDISFVGFYPAEIISNKEEVGVISASLEDNGSDRSRAFSLL